MEQNVTFNKLLSFLQRFANNSRFINTYGFGNLVEFGKDVDNTTPLYPLLFVVPNSVEYNENTTTWGITVFLADKLNDDLEGAESIISNMSMVMRDLISTFKLSDVYMDIADFDFPLIGQPFLERFNDVLAGVSVDFNFTVSDYMEICEIEEELDYTITINGQFLGGAGSSNGYNIYEDGIPIVVERFTADTIHNKTIILDPNKVYGYLVLSQGKNITTASFKAGNEVIQEIVCDDAMIGLTANLPGNTDYVMTISQSYDCPDVEIITEDNIPITLENGVTLIIKE